VEKSYYEILEISETATTAEIDASYKRLVKLFHPDRNPGYRTDATEKLKRINTAYEALKDPARRRQYDVEIGVSSTKIRDSSARSRPTEPNDDSRPPQEPPPRSDQLTASFLALANEKLTGEFGDVATRTFRKKVEAMTPWLIPLLREAMAADEILVTMAGFSERVTSDPMLFLATDRQCFIANDGRLASLDHKFLKVSGRRGLVVSKLVMSDGQKTMKVTVDPRKRINEVLEWFRAH
jgi:hypothetical protein